MTIGRRTITILIPKFLFTSCSYFSVQALILSLEKNIQSSATHIWFQMKPSIFLHFKLQHFLNTSFYIIHLGTTILQLKLFLWQYQIDNNLRQITHAWLLWNWSWLHTSLRPWPSMPVMLCRNHRKTIHIFGEAWPYRFHNRTNHNKLHMHTYFITQKIIQ